MAETGGMKVAVGGSSQHSQCEVDAILHRFRRKVTSFVVGMWPGVGDKVQNYGQRHGVPVECKSWPHLSPQQRNYRLLQDGVPDVLLVLDGGRRARHLADVAFECGVPTLDAEGRRMSRKFFYKNVKGLGNVAVSRHALSRMDAFGVSEEAFERVLLEPIRPDIPDGQGVLWRERDGLRVVILTNPAPDRGAKLVKTVFRVQLQA